jgi:hypothetical protein
LENRKEYFCIGPSFIPPSLSASNCQNLRPFPKLQAIRRQMCISSRVSISSRISKPNVETIISQDKSQTGFGKIKNPTSAIGQ